MSQITINVENAQIRCNAEDADTIRAAWVAADEGGTIQAEQMVALSSDPRKHTATSVTQFVKSLGGEVIDL